MAGGLKRMPVDVPPDLLVRFDRFVSSDASPYGNRSEAVRAAMELLIRGGVIPTATLPPWAEHIVDRLDQMRDWQFRVAALLQEVHRKDLSEKAVAAINAEVARWREEMG